MEDNKVFVISGPSGAGKGALVKRVFARVPNLYYAVSGTTRPPRPGEVAGKNYFFLNEKEFQERVKKGEFLEWVEVYKYHYGTLRSQLDQGLASGQDVVLELDPQGAAQIKKRLPRSILIFIAPPSLRELKERLKKRSSESLEEMKIRLKEAEKEIKLMANYDYKVVNDKIDRAAEELKGIIEKERGKLS